MQTCFIKLMKILQIVNPVIAFPPTTVGGIERVVQYLLDELVLAGHEVTLMAHSDSIVDSKVQFIPIGTYLDQQHTTKIIWKHLLLNRYDVIHNHGRLIYFLPHIWNNTKKIHTFHLAELDTKSFRRFLALRPKNLTLSPCAKWIEEEFSYLKANWAFVNNGIPIHKYSYIPTTFNDDMPLVIICRIGPGKGLVDALEIALKTNKKLIIAGKVGTYAHEIEWFEQNVLKYCDGEQIKFIGVVNDEEKQQLLANAGALLMLSADSEAFNLTMLEANACGCPVISYNRFFPPDFIKDGINGFIGTTQVELIDKIASLPTVNRANCRKEFEQNYTSAIMMQNYMKLYLKKN